MKIPKIKHCTWCWPHDGWVWVRVDGKRVKQTCYFCSGTGLK